MSEKKENSHTSVEVSSSLDKVPEEVLIDFFEGAKNKGVEDRYLGERYTYVSVLGEGGQGTVISARDELLERYVAIKTLKKHHDPAHERMLEKEARLCGQLEHPNILPTYDLAYDGTESPLFVMKKLEAQTFDITLRQLQSSDTDGLQRNRIRLLNIFQQVLNAVDFAHSRGILHLDIKPGNVCTGKFGEVYLIDWGFARKIKDNTKHISGGTMYYMAPERMNKRHYDERADIYSLGVMLYRLLTGRHPRNAGKMTFKEYKINHTVLPLITPRERDGSISPVLEAITLKAMADHPDDRYASVHELGQDIERYLQMLPVSAYQENIFGKSWLFLRRHRRILTAAAALVLMLGVTAFALWRQHQTQLAVERSESEKIRLEKAENERRLANRKRYEARRVLKRANDLLEKSREAVEAASEKSRKIEILVPVIDLYNQAIKIDKTYAEAYEKRGFAHKVSQEFNEALVDYQQAFKEDSSYFMSLYEAGMLLVDVFEKPEEARSKFREMEKFFPRDEYSYLGQARVDLLEADKYLKLSPKHRGFADRKRQASRLYQRVLERCEKISEINPALSDVWYIRGLVYQKSPEHHDLQRALKAYDIYLSSRRDSESPSAFHNRGDAKKDLGDIDGAIADYTEALKLNPDFVISLRNRGYLLYRYKHENSKALIDINRAIKISPQDAWSYMDRGSVYCGMKNYSLARKDYLQALKISPNNPRILYRLGVLSLYAENTDSAVKYFTQALKYASEDDNAITYHRRGIALLSQGNYADAVSDFEDSLRLRKEGKVYPALMRFLAIKFEGLPIDKEDFAAMIDAPEDKPWLIALSGLYLDEASEGDVLKMAEDPFADLPNVLYTGTSDQKEKLLSASNLAAVCESRFYLGALALGNKDYEKARGHLQAAVDTGEHLYMEHALAKVFLKLPAFSR